MHVLIKTIKIKILNTISSIGREYVSQKYGKKSLLCTVTGDNGQIQANFGNGESSVWDALPDVCYPIRKQCGEYVLMRYGFPSKNEGPPTIFLLPTPSMLTALGLKGFSQFINDWPGDSKVGELVVVRYENLL